MSDGAPLSGVLGAGATGVVLLGRGVVAAVALAMGVLVAETVVAVLVTGVFVAAPTVAVIVGVSVVCALLPDGRALTAAATAMQATPRAKRMFHRCVPMSCTSHIRGFLRLHVDLSVVRLPSRTGQGSSRSLPPRSL
jgi:hypothetical protein